MSPKTKWAQVVSVVMTFIGIGTIVLSQSLPRRAEGPVIVTGCVIGAIGLMILHYTIRMSAIDRDKDQGI